MSPQPGSARAARVRGNPSQEESPQPGSARAARVRGNPSQEESPALTLGFAGTPDFAVRILRALLDSPHRVSAVFTQPDRPAGRRRRLTPSPTRRFAEAHAVPVYTPERIGEELPRLASLDVLVVAAYGLILPPTVLEAPARDCINVHASLLPRWRGAAPVERAIMAGDTTTGISIMRIDTGLDSGPVFARRSTPIGADETGAALTERLADLGAQTLLECLDRLDEIEPTPQDDAQATRAPKLTARDAIIDWTRPAADIALQVRALSGRRSAFATRDGERIGILAARATDADASTPGRLERTAAGFTVACGAGALLLDTVQLSRGKGRPMVAQAAANGFPELFAAGVQFDVPG